MRSNPILLCLLLTLVALSGLSAFSQEQRPTAQTHSPNYQEPAKPEEKGTLGAPLIVKAMPAEKSEKESADDAKEKASKASNDYVALLVAVGTLAVVTVQTIVFGLQARRLKQTIDTMKKVSVGQSADMQASIEVTRKAADAASESAKVARDTLVAANRPWIRIESVTPRGLIAIGPDTLSARVDLQLVNCGNSPALGVFTRMWIIGMGFMMPDELFAEHRKRFEEANAIVETQALTIFHGQRIPEEGKKFFVGATLGKGEIIPPVADGLLDIFIGGCIGYRFDFDEPNTIRKTSFLRAVHLKDRHAKFTFGDALYEVGADEYVIYPLGAGDYAT